MSTDHFSHLPGSFFKEVRSEETLLVCIAMYRELWINYFYLFNSYYWNSSLILLFSYSSLILYYYSLDIIISIIHLIPVSDFSQSHLECYMKLVADTSIFLRIVLLRNNIKIKTASHPTTHLYLNMDGHYRMVHMADTCGMISYLSFYHWFISCFIS